jgi:hypothetical protein
MNADNPTAADGRNQTMQVPECPAGFPLRLGALAREFEKASASERRMELRPRYRTVNTNLSQRRQDAKENLPDRGSPIVCNLQIRLIFPGSRRGARRFYTAVQMKNKLLGGPANVVNLIAPRRFSRTKAAATRRTRDLMPPCPPPPLCPQILTLILFSSCLCVSVVNAFL